MTSPTIHNESTTNKGETMSITLDELVAGYHERKRQVAEIDAEAKRRTAPLKEEMKTLEAAMQHMLNQQGANSVKTQHGTCYKTTWSSLKIEDWESAIAWVRDNERWDVLTHALNKTAVMEEAEDDNCPIPGVSIERGTKVNVRRA